MKFSSNKKLATGIIGGFLMLGATNASAFDLSSICEMNVFVSGASAQDESYEAQVRGLMDTGLLTTLDGQAINNGAIFFGEQEDDFNVIVGRIDESQVTNFMGNPVACFHKRSAGGSAWGVQPVSQGTGLIGGVASPYTQGTGIVMMRPVDCTTTTADEGTCNLLTAGGAELIIPDVGLSDVEPAQFTSFNTPAPTFDGSEGFGVASGTGLADPSFVGMSTSDVAALNIRQQSMFAFGVIVNPEFYEALQVCQGLVSEFGLAPDLDNLNTMPSLTKAQVVGMYTGRGPDLRSIPCTNFSADAAKPATMNLYEVCDASADCTAPTQFGLEVCTRVDGSGTQAQFRIKFMGTGCNANSFIDFAPPTVSQPFPGFFAPFALSENQSSSNMDGCVGGLAANSQEPLAVRWKVGFNATGKNSSVDNNPGDADYYRFVKVDGTAPTLENTHTGAWFDAVQATLQTRTATQYYDDVIDTIQNDVGPVIDQLIANFGSVSDIASANSLAANTGGATGNPAWYGGSLAITGPGANGCDIATSATGFGGDTYPCSLVTHSPGAAVLDNCRVPELTSSTTIADGDGML